MCKESCDVNYRFPTPALFLKTQTFLFTCTNTCFKLGNYDLLRKGRSKSYIHDMSSRVQSLKWNFILELHDEIKPWITGSCDEIILGVSNHLHIVLIKLCMCFGSWSFKKHALWWRICISHTEHKTLQNQRPDIAAGCIYLLYWN